MSFKDAVEVHKYLGGVFEVAFADPEIGPKLRATGIVLKTIYSAPDAIILIDTTTGEVTEGELDSACTASMAMTADTGNAYWQGKVNLPLAMAKKARSRWKGMWQRYSSWHPSARSSTPLHRNTPGRLPRRSHRLIRKQTHVSRCSFTGDA